jgi:predicted transcriptional regulator with HTH domain
MPESPRWLVWQGRTDEARDVLHQLHGEDPNYSATAEVELLVAAFDEEKAIRAPSIMDVFKGTDLRRTIISVYVYSIFPSVATSSPANPNVSQLHSGVQCLQQAQGSSYMTNYIVLFLISLGMTNIFQVVMICTSSNLSSFSTGALS